MTHLTQRQIFLTFLSLAKAIRYPPMKCSDEIVQLDIKVILYFLITNFYYFFKCRLDCILAALRNFSALNSSQGNGRYQMKTLSFMYNNNDWPNQPLTLFQPECREFRIKREGQGGGDMVQTQNKTRGLQLRLQYQSVRYSQKIFFQSSLLTQA